MLGMCCEPAALASRPESAAREPAPPGATAGGSSGRAAKPAAQKAAPPRVLIDPDDPFAGIDELSAEDFLEAVKKAGG